MIRFNRPMGMYMQGRDGPIGNRLIARHIRSGTPQLSKGGRKCAPTRR
jgi:hypothetical protein